MPIKQVCTRGKRPVKMWLTDIEEGALEQAVNLSNLPFAFNHIPIMPDAHRGYGMPIGAVLPTKRAIVPNSVGVDIGCGMCAVRTNLTDIDRESLKDIMGIIRHSVPVGHRHHDSPQSEAYMPILDESLRLIVDQYDHALYQVGTLGGGNHFIEVQHGSDGFIWIMIHSGSRNLGYRVAKHYHEKAVEMNRRWFSDVPDDLAFFPIESDLFGEYVDHMEYCIEFARLNRVLMMKRVQQAFVHVLGYGIEFPQHINKPHNFASWENHFGQNLIVHRKGATRARKDELGMIPGSQGESSFIVVGKGDQQSFTSCSHGAGRTMSRTQAKKTLDFEAEKQALEDRGILHTLRHRDNLDEAPGSYKNINDVMANQTDLVDIEVVLTPLATIKG